MKKLLILLVALLLALPAQAQEVARGRYVQENIGLPQGASGVYAMDLDGEGRVRILFSGQENRMARAVLNEDGGWTVQDLPWWDQLLSAFGETTPFAGAMAGEDVYLAIYLPQEDESYSYQVLLGRGESLIPIDNGEMTQDIAMMVGNLAAGDDVVLIKDYPSGAYSYDSRTGHRLAGYPQAGAVMWVAQDEIYTLDQEGQSALVLDLQTGQTLYQMDGAPLGDDNAVYGDGQSFYLLNRGGVYRIALGGSMWEQLVDGSLTELRQADTYPVSLCVAGEALYAQVGGGGQRRLLRFTYDPSAPALPTKTLSVYTLYPSRLAEQAAADFIQTYPEYTVQVTTLLEEGSGATRQDVVNALGVELLAGKGPDVMILDGLPAGDYAEKGVLADLSQVVNPMLERGELFENLFTPFYDGGAVYRAPTRAVPPVALGDIGARDWEALLQAVEAGLTLPPRSLEGYVEMFLPTCFPAWFDEAGALREDVLADFLTGIQRIEAACGQASAEYLDMLNQYIQMYQAEARYQGMALVPMNGYMANGQDLVGMMRGRYAMLPTMLQGISRSQIELRQVEDLGGGVALLPGQAGKICALATLAGVNARSGEIEGARAFVGVMLSQSVQDADLYDGAWPVNRISFQKVVDTDRTDSMYGYTAQDMETGEMVEVNSRWPTRETREAVYELLNQAEGVYAPDETLLGLVRQALSPFYAGEMAPQQAAQAVAARVRAYLAE